MIKKIMSSLHGSLDVRGVMHQSLLTHRKHSMTNSCEYTWSHTFTNSTAHPTLPPPKIYMTQKDSCFSSPNLTVNEYVCALFDGLL